MFVGWGLSLFQPNQTGIPAWVPYIKGSQPPIVAYNFQDKLAWVNDAPAWLPFASGKYPSFYTDFSGTGNAWTGDGNVSGSVVPITSLVSVSRTNTFFGGTITGYGRNSSGVWQPYTADTIRYDYQGGVQGIMNEESTTNTISNSSNQGAAAGTPGAIPTNWAGFPAAVDGLNRRISNITTTDNIDTIDIDFPTGTTTVGTSVSRWFLEVSSTIVVAAGEIWTGSAFLASVGGAYNWNGVRISARFYSDAAGTVQVGGTLSGADVGPSLTSTLQRFETQFTVPATAIRSVLLLEMTTPTGVGTSTSTVFRLGGYQYEKAPRATSPIRTGSAQVTRSQDLPSANLPASAQGLNTYTLYSRATPYYPVTALTDQVSLSISDNSINNSVSVGRLATTGAYKASVNAGGVNIYTQTGGTWNEDTQAKMTASQSASDQVGYFQGGTQITPGATAGTLATVSKVKFGMTGDNSKSFNGFTTIAAVWANRVTNTDQQSLTT